MPVTSTNIVAAADVLQAQIEKVRNKLQVYFETSDQISSLVKGKGEVETISQKLYRIPIMLYRGGTFAKFNADAGDMGSGSGMKIDKLTAGYIYSDYVCEISLESIDTTKTKEQAVVNVFAKQLAEAMTELKAYDDIAFHTSGNSVLTNASSAYAAVGGKSTYTFAGATDYLGIGRLREGMAVSAWASALNAKRTYTQVPVIESIDYSSKTVTLNQTLGNTPATGDVLAFANITSDSALATGQSGWPLSGDSFRHGFPYANDSSLTYYLGQTRASIPQLNPTRVNASGALTFQHGLLMLDGIIQRRDPDAVKGLVGIAHMSQRAAVHNLGISVSNWLRSEQSQKMIDVMPSNIGYTDTFDYCGIKCYLSKRQDRSRLDFINPKVWGRAQLHDTKFHEVGGKTLFESRTSSGSLKAAVHFIVVQAYDFVCFDPGCQGYVDNLTLPSGY